MVGCGSEQDCPNGHLCTRLRRSGSAVCCPNSLYDDNSTDSDMIEVGLMFHIAGVCLQRKVKTDKIKLYIQQVTLETCGSEAEALCGLNSTIICPEGTCHNDLVCCATSTCGPVCIDPAKMRLQADRVDDTPTSKNFTTLLSRF